jgi:hypothetical protein
MPPQTGIEREARTHATACETPVSLPPGVFERRDAQLPVASRVLDRSMTEPVLNAARVVNG